MRPGQGKKRLSVDDATGPLIPNLPDSALNKEQEQHDHSFKSREVAINK